MPSQRTALFYCMVLLLSGILFSAARGMAQPDAGAHTFHLPLLTRAEPTLSELRAIAPSEGPPYTQFGRDPELYIVPSDGSALIRLTDNDVPDINPHWSPDGTRIAWESDDDAWLMNADGSNARPLSQLPGRESPLWSPDGASIALLGYDINAPQGARNALYVTTPAANALTPVLTGTNIYDFFWSPDGAYLTFTRAPAPDALSQPSQVYTVRADGSALQLLGDGTARAQAWSPDSAWLAFTAATVSGLDVYVARPDGSEIIHLADSPDDEEPLYWVEEGARLLIERRIAGSGDAVEIAIELITFPEGAATPFLSADAPPYPQVLGVSPDSATIAYMEGTTTTRELFLRDTTPADSAPTAISPVLPCRTPVCKAQWAGWSHNGEMLAYAYVENSVYGYSITQLYVAGNDGNPRLLDETGVTPHWLPYSTWLSAYAAPDGDDTRARRLHLFHPPTGRFHTVPHSPEGKRLLEPRWQYAP